MRRVVVTGLGIVSCIGNNQREVLEALQQGRSGIEAIPERKTLGFRSCLGGRIKGLEPPDIPKRNLRQMGPAHGVVTGSDTAVFALQLDLLTQDQRGGREHAVAFDLHLAAGGDEHAGEYGEDVFNQFLHILKTDFRGVGRYIRKDFDSAADQFEPGSIDLLHIDGLHTYEAVKNDFSTWLPKLSDKGVIMFHDTEVREKGFGVYRLWNEVSERYPSFSFEHGYGLGLIYVGSDADSRAARFFRATGRDDAGNLLRRFFSLKGKDSVLLAERQLRISGLEDQVSGLGDHVRGLEAHISEIEEHARGLGDRIMGLEKANKDKENTLSEIYGLRGWRTLQYYYRSKNTLLNILRR